jgi:hypothetical protein
MIEYLKTKKVFFYKLKKNGEKKKISKKKISKKKYQKKNISRKFKKIIGGTLSELDDLDVSIKTIVLIGELHTSKQNRLQYNNVIRKQKEIIGRVKDKFGEDKTYFYSEAPEEYRNLILTSDNYHSSVIVQYAASLFPIKLSSITTCDRETSDCDEKYTDDILSIFDNPEINCLIVSIGLLHVPELNRFIHIKQPDIKIIIINTVSKEELVPLIPQMRTKYQSVIELLKIEKPYELPNETFIVEVLYNEDNEKIYKCPLCKQTTGTFAPKYPNDTSLFTHIYNCPNKNKIPIEN